MWSPKFSSKDDISSQPSSHSSLSADPVSSINSGSTWKLELYPYRRPTQFYYEPDPGEEYQSRCSEHPKDKLNDRSQKVKRKTTGIRPPSSPAMRDVRNSYFS